MAGKKHKISLKKVWLDTSTPNLETENRLEQNFTAIRPNACTRFKRIQFKI